MLFHFILNKLLLIFEKLDYGSLELTLPNGQTYRFQGKNPGRSADVTIHDPRVLFNFFFSGETGLCRDYCCGKWDSKDLVALICLVLSNFDSIGRRFSGNFLYRLLFTKVFSFFKENTKKGSRKNIRDHYDLGNNFYRLWLDPSMTYSSALFQEDGEELFQAQYNKCDRILERIGSETGKEILEIGCGWGSFVERALQRGDHRVTGLTISDAQYDYACQRLRHAFPQARIHRQDYRETQGNYDAIVSIEMFEAVGRRYWSVFFNKVKSLLSEKGIFMLQTIVIRDDIFDAYVKRGDSIRRYIFPGGLLSCPKRLRYDIERAGLRITDRYAFGQSYAKTLSCWLANFEERLQEVREQNFDDRFIRLWRYYLAYCIGAFTYERTNVMQLEIRHA